MFCIINPNIALRSWANVAYAFYLRHQSGAIGLKQEEFERLILADSQHDLPEDEVLSSLIRRGFARPCERG